MTVWRRLEKIVAEHGAAVLVTVHATKGSVPREAGARMVVRPDGAFHGTIGGGALEWQALAAAREAIATGRGPARFIEKTLGPDLGQCCGGQVTLLVETFDGRDATELMRLAGVEGGTFALEARMGNDGRVERSAFPSPLRGGVGVGGAGPERDGVGSSHPDPAARPSSPSALFASAPHPARPSAESALPSRGRGAAWSERYGEFPTPLLLFGAGHVGRALVLALAPLPFSVRWIDGREDAFPPYIPAHATAIHTADPVAEIARGPADAFVLVMTHSHPLDLAVTAEALRRPFPFVGLIGSATKRARFERRFRALGIAEERIRALACPIGMPGIAGKEPAVIAASVAAQLLAERERIAAGAAAPVSRKALA